MIPDRSAALAAGFLSAPLSFAGQPLRPLTAGSMLILQELRNPLFTAAEAADPAAAAEEEDPAESLLAILEFVWVHTAPMDQVIAAARDGAAGRALVRQEAWKMSLTHPLETVVAFGEQFGGMKERLEAAMTTEAPGAEDEPRGKPGLSGLPASSTPSAGMSPPSASAGSCGSSPSSAPSSTSTPSSVPVVATAGGAAPAVALPPHVIQLPSLPGHWSNGAE